MGYPVCLVEVYGKDESFTISQETNPARPFGNSPSDDLLACTTSKHLNPNAPAGIFTLVLTSEPDQSGRTWDQRIHPQDTVVIQMANYQGITGPYGAGELHTVMVGFVDHIELRTALDPSSGKPRRVVQVQGRDAAKLLVTGMVTQWSFLGANLMGAQTFTDTSLFNTSPDQAVQTLVEDIFAQFVKVENQVAGGAMPFFDLLATRLASYPDTEIPGGLDLRFTGGEGSFWSFLMTCASAPFHELFVDTRRVRDLDDYAVGLSGNTPSTTFGRDGSCPVLAMRPTPFPSLTAPSERVLPPIVSDGGQVNMSAVQTIGSVDRTVWDKLRRHVISKEDALGEPFTEQAGVSDEEVYNLYLLMSAYMNITPSVYIANVPAIINPDSMTRYGYRPLTPSTTLLSTADVKQEDLYLVSYYRKLAWKMASWFALNDQYRSGVKVCRLMPHVHIGERLSDQSGWHKEPMEYYIESVSHQFQWGERATTSLGVTRGLRRTDDLSYGAKLSNVGLVEMMPENAVASYQELFANANKQPPGAN